MSNDERMPNDETQIAKRVNDLSSFGLYNSFVIRPFVIWHSSF